MRKLALFVVVLATLGVAGCGLVAKPHVERQPPRQVNVSVFLRDDATEQQKQAIEEKLRTNPAASAITFETREEAYRKFKELYEGEPRFADVTPESLPESFQLTLHDRAAAEALKTELLPLPGVEDVVLPATGPPSPPR